MLEDMVPPADSGHRPEYDLLLKAGHVIDSRNHINDVQDVAVRDGRIVAVAPDIPIAPARKVIDVSGLYVTPGLFDFHFHCYAGPADAETGDNMTVFPDPFTFRNGVTTVGEAGSSGWRTFPDFKRRVIDRVRTRILTFLHIAGSGSASGRVQDLADMDAKATAELAVRYRDHIIGIKTADYEGPEWTPFERALEAATSSGVPWFCDFGALRPERPLAELMQQRLRAGDIYTHIYAATRGETDGSGRPVPALWHGRQRGVLFDVGPGGGSFLFRSAIEFLKEGFVPDIISSDRHLGSSGTRYFMTDLLSVMSRFLNMGMPLESVVGCATWNPARAVQRTELGNLSPSAPADIAVLNVENGNFGFVDMYGARLRGTEQLVCELTVRGGKVVFDRNGISRPDWDTLPGNYRHTGDSRWDAVYPRPADNG
jgi:dihydroorotase